MVPIQEKSKREFSPKNNKQFYRERKNDLSNQVTTDDSSKLEQKSNKLFSALRFLVRDTAVGLASEEGFVYDRDRRKLNVDFVHILNKGLNDLFKERFPDYRDGGYCGVFAYIMAVCLKEAYGVKSFVIRSFTDDLQSMDSRMDKIKTIHQLNSLVLPKIYEHTYYGFILNNTLYIGDSYGLHTEKPLLKPQGKNKYNLLDGIVSKDTVVTEYGDTVEIDYKTSQTFFVINSNKLCNNSKILLPFEREILKDLSNTETEPKEHSIVWLSGKRESLFQDKDFGVELNKEM